MSTVSRLEALLAEIANAPVLVERRSDAYAAINQGAVDLKVAVHQVGILRSALEMYAPESFYADVAPTSTAGQDRGERARWVLRLTDPNPV